MVVAKRCEEGLKLAGGLDGRYCGAKTGVDGGLREGRDPRVRLVDWVLAEGGR